MKVVPIVTRLFAEGEDLHDFVEEHLPSLKEGSILAVASKIVALAEGRVTEARSAKDTSCACRLNVRRPVSAEAEPIPPPRAQPANAAVSTRAALRSWSFFTPSSRRPCDRRH